MLNTDQEQAFLEYLRQFVTDAKWQRFNEVLQNRTKHLTLVIEDIYQPQNASAVIRTAECLGIQELHIIEDKQLYVLNKDIVVGSSQWVRMRKHKKSENNTALCYARLREEGYKIYATTPHKDQFTPDNIPLQDKMAIVFGNEADGLSEYAMKNADGFLCIPMYGFTESYNISVAASIAAHRVIQRLHESDVNWKLSKKDHDEILLQWMKKSIRTFDLLRSEFFTKHGGKN